MLHRQCIYVCKDGEHREGESARKRDFRFSKTVNRKVEPQAVQRDATAGYRLISILNATGDRSVLMVLPLTRGGTAMEQVLSVAGAVTDLSPLSARLNYLGPFFFPSHPSFDD